MDTTDLRSRARSAIQSVARQQNLPDNLVLISERWNTVAKLGDSGVIAKAATHAHLAKSNPHHWCDIEVQTCSTLRERGVSVHFPYANKVFIVNGLPITLWHEVHGDMGECTEEELVASLAAIHRVGDDLMSDQPWFATITTHFNDIFPIFRDRNIISKSEVLKLESHFQRLLSATTNASLTYAFVHGDAQRKNAIRTADGAVWIDFEEASYGPVAWDLACLTMNRRFDTNRVLDRYAELSGLDRIRNADIQMLQQLRDLEAVTWMLAIQDHREPEFRTEAAKLLQEVLADASDD